MGGGGGGGGEIPPFKSAQVLVFKYSSKVTTVAAKYLQRCILAVKTQNIGKRHCFLVGGRHQNPGSPRKSSLL